jgi:hypothetical protein
VDRSSGRSVGIIAVCTSPYRDAPFRPNRSPALDPSSTRRSRNHCGASFLVPSARSVGGYLLLSIFAIAGVLHFLHGEFNVGGLVVYGMAVIVCMTHPNREAVEASHDR